MNQVELTAHGLFALVLTALALYLFTRDKFSLETSSLAVLALLVGVFTAFPFEYQGEPLDPGFFFAGFGNEALIAVCALMVVGKGMETTGALQPLAGIIARAWTARPALALLVTMVVGAVLSAFLNNTPIVVMLLPILVGVSRQRSSKALKPMPVYPSSATARGARAWLAGDDSRLPAGT